MYRFTSHRASHVLPGLLLCLLLCAGMSAHAWADGSTDGTGAEDPEVFPSTATGDSASGGADPSGSGAPFGGMTVGAGGESTTAGGDLDLTAALDPDDRGPRLKDIGKVGGLRTNQLYGVGLVVGLASTGDDSQLTAQMVASYMQRQDVAVHPGALKGKNFAAVTLTAVLPPFVQVGDTLDVTVSAMGTTKSLEGGILILSPLKAANGTVYGLAQGALTLGAFGVTAGGGGARASAQKNFLTVARIPNGASIEVPVASDLPQGARFDWVLKEADFTTANRAAEALNRAIPGVNAIAEDGQRISLGRPAGYAGSLVSFIAAVEQVQVTTDMPARIVINERNGTIVAGADVRIKPVSIAHGSLSVTVSESLTTNQPTTPFGGGRTTVTPGATVDVTEEAAQVGTATTVRDLLDAVSSVGGSIRDAVAILQALKAAGAIDAELVVI